MMFHNNVQTQQFIYLKQVLIKNQVTIKICQNVASEKLQTLAHKSSLSYIGLNIYSWLAGTYL